MAMFPDPNTGITQDENGWLRWPGKRGYITCYVCDRKMTIKQVARSAPTVCRGCYGEPTDSEDITSPMWEIK